MIAPQTYLAPPDQETAPPWNSLLHRPSTVPGLNYELSPNMSRGTRHGKVDTNQFGMRDDEPLPGDTPDLYRVAAVGDSYTFGFKVRAEQTYPNVLERLLANAEWLNGRPVEVLNLGVGGYSTADEALVVRHKVPQWKPDFVTVGYFLNDPEIDPIQPLHAHFAPVAWWRHSHLARLVAQALVNYKVKEWGGGDYYRYLHYPQGDKWRSVVEGFGEIAAFSRESGIPVLLVIFPAFPPDKWDGYRYADIHQQVADAARAAGLEVLDLLPAYRQIQQPAKLWAAKNDDHPSVLGHRIAANAILAKMRAMLADGDGLNSARGAK